MSETEFLELIKQKGAELYRDMPWRADTRPYYVLVSELMLQQTQVDRVIPKFNAFIQAFPNEKTLASASLGDVLRLWSGLGYNRRAKFLHEAAKKIVLEHGGKFPESYEDILALPGVGQSTAGAITAYAFNKPIIFIETNVRTVYFHHFFNDESSVTDKQILQKMQKTAPWAEGKEQPERRIYSAPGAMRKTVGLSYGPKAFYWSLMDYGTWLKKNHPSYLTKSKHYKKQAPLKGSIREVRGQIVRLLTEKPIEKQKLIRHFKNDSRFETALKGLIQDGLVQTSGTIFHLTK